MKIRLENIHKAYGDKKIHQGISFEIPAGQKCVILGGSGVGKSQLIRQIVGLVQPDQGRIFLDDLQIVGMSESELMAVRQKMGFIFQDGGLLKSLTVGENIVLPLREIQKPGKDRIKEKLDKTLELLNLKGLEDQQISDISGGQRKRVAIARALVCDVQVFFFDEPTAGLDPETAQTVDEVINDVNKNTGATTVVVTHDLRSVEAIADRIVMLHDGTVCFDGTLKELFSSEDEVVRNFLKRELTPLNQ